MNDQQVFDAALAHARAQKALSRSTYISEVNAESVRCAYRSGHDRKCFIGALIKDEHYKPSLEGKNASCVDVLHALGLSGVQANPWFVQELQLIHDNTPLHTAHKGPDVLLDYWETKFKRLAKRRDLNYTPPGN